MLQLKNYGTHIIADRINVMEHCFNKTAIKHPKSLINSKPYIPHQKK